MAEIVYPRCAISSFIILEATNMDEYASLKDDVKSTYNLLISAGMLDVRVGSSVRELLLKVIFPEGTKSHEMILAAIS